MENYYGPPLDHPRPPADEQEQQYQQYAYPPPPTLQDPSSIKYEYSHHADQQQQQQQQQQYANFDSSDNDLPNFDDMETPRDDGFHYGTYSSLTAGEQVYHHHSNSHQSLLGGGSTTMMTMNNDNNLVTVYKKAPGAPKRFKSSYVLFYSDFLNRKKNEVGPDGRPLKFEISAVSKECSRAWKNISLEEKRYWNDLSATEKRGYMEQKAAYDGPWRIATNKVKKKKKDEGAPKRSPSAFFLFANVTRPLIKEENPNMPPIAVIKTCSTMWKQLPELEKRPYLEEEQRLRAQYHINVEQWKRDVKERKKSSKRARKQATGMVSLKNDGLDEEQEQEERLMTDYHLGLPDLPIESSGIVLFSALRATAAAASSSSSSVPPPGGGDVAARSSSTSSNSHTSRDPTAPKRSPPAFFLFVNHCRQALRNEYPDLKQTELIKLLGQKWAAMNDVEKSPFRAEEELLRQQYHTNMLHYRKQAIP